MSKQNHPPKGQWISPLLLGLFFVTALALRADDPLPPPRADSPLPLPTSQKTTGADKNQKPGSPSEIPSPSNPTITPRPLSPGIPDLPPPVVQGRPVDGNSSGIKQAVYTESNYKMTDLPPAPATLPKEVIQPVIYQAPILPNPPVAKQVKDDPKNNMTLDLPPVPPPPGSFQDQPKTKIQMPPVPQPNPPAPINNLGGNGEMVLPKVKTQTNRPGKTDAGFQIPEPAKIPEPMVPPPPAGVQNSKKVKSQSFDFEPDQKPKSPPAFRLVDGEPKSYTRKSLKPHESKRAKDSKGTEKIPAGKTPGSLPASVSTQSPVVILENSGPQQGNVGEPLEFVVVARNIGKQLAGKVIIENSLPLGMSMISSLPPARVNGQVITWQLEGVKPGESRKCVLRVKVARPGLTQIISTSKVIFSQTTSIQVQGMPMVVEVDGPKAAKVGEKVVVQIKVKNESSQTSNEMVIQAQVPSGLRHPVGPQIEADLGPLAPGGTKEIKLELEAMGVGNPEVTVKVLSEKVPVTSGSTTIKIQNAAKLLLKKSGPPQLVQGKMIEYRLEVSNQSKNPAHNIVIFDQLPEALEFIAASNKGNFDPRTRTVQWFFDDLEPGQTRAVAVRLQGARPGVVRNEVTAHASDAGQVGLMAELTVDGSPEADRTVAPAGFIRSPFRKSP